MILSEKFRIITDYIILYYIIFGKLFISDLSLFVGIIVIYRFTIYKVHKPSKKKREKSSAKKERKATKTLAIVLGKIFENLKISTIKYFYF